MPDFDIEILSNPALALNHGPLWDIDDYAQVSEYDLNLIRPALIFADHVRLVTFRETMRDLIWSHGSTLYSMPMSRLFTFFDICIRRDSREIEVLGLNPDELPTSKEARAAKESRGELLEQFWEKYEDKVDFAANQARKIWGQRYRQLAAPELESVARSGVLTVEGWLPPIPRDWRAIDLDEVIKLSMDLLLERLENSTRQPMLDVGADWAVKNWPFRSVRSRSVKQEVARWQGPTMVGADAVMRLPGLDRLSLAEVLDLRNDLRQYLPAFRSEMVRLGEDLAQSDDSQSSEDLTAEIDKRWHRDIAPVLAEIQQQVITASYPRRLINTITAQKDSMASVGGAIVLASGSVAAGISTIAPAALAAAYPLAKALNETVSARGAARKHRLYLLYALQKGIDKRLQ